MNTYYSKQKTVTIHEKTNPQKSSGITHLKDAVVQLLDRQILPRHKKFNPLTELWGQMLPPELEKHCRIEDIKAGTLAVKVDSPVYLYELKMCSEQLVEYINQHCPSASIKNIKFSVGY